MPPSGYSLNEINHIAGFLKSVCASLKDEGQTKKVTPLEILHFECDNIQVELDRLSDDDVVWSVLKLTGGFYSRLINLQPKDYNELDILVDKCLNSLKDDLLAIHIPG